VASKLPNAIRVTPPIPKLGSRLPFGNKRTTPKLSLAFASATISVNIAATAILPSGCKTASSMIKLLLGSEIVTCPPWPKVGSSTPAAAWAGPAPRASAVHNSIDKKSGAILDISVFSVLPNPCTRPEKGASSKRNDPCRSALFHERFHR